MRPHAVFVAVTAMPAVEGLFQPRITAPIPVPQRVETDLLMAEVAEVMTPVLAETAALTVAAEEEAAKVLAEQAGLTAEMGAPVNLHRIRM